LKTPIGVKQPVFAVESKVRKRREEINRYQGEKLQVTIW